MSLLQLCLVGLLFAAAQQPAAASWGRHLLQANATANATANTTANATFIAHECLWTAAAASASASVTGGGQASAEATASSAAAGGNAAATAVATATATASATGSTAVASASATALSAAVPAGSCSLNPSFFFSLPEPQSAEERLLLKITAQRYGCVNHTTFDQCAGDQQNWCTWHDDSSECSMVYDDADFPHLLLWSGAGVACEGSKVAQIVQCSYLASDSDCQAQKPACSWVEGACYPAFYSQILTKPQSLAAFKRQMHTGQAAVWGSCAGADLYKRYSAVCNTATQATCVADSQCEWINDYDTNVAPNPLNFSKPCILATTKFPIESVYLTGTSKFSAAVLAAQKECLQGDEQAACVARTATLAVNVLETALSFSPATAPAAATNNSSDANAAADGATTFVAAWAGLGNEPALLQLGDEITPGSIPLPHTGKEQPPLLSGGPSAALTSLEGASLRKLLGRLSGRFGSWRGIGRRLAAGEPAPKSCSTPSTCRAVASLTKLHIVRPKKPKAA